MSETQPDTYLTTREFERFTTQFDKRMTVIEQLAAQQNAQDIELARIAERAHLAEEMARNTPGKGLSTGISLAVSALTTGFLNFLFGVGHK